MPFLETTEGCRDNKKLRIRFCIDTAWAVDVEQNPIQMAEKFADRLYGAHSEDFVFDRAQL